MGACKQQKAILCLLVTVVGVAAVGAKEQFFEFGDQTGRPFYVKDGTVKNFSYNNDYSIDILPNMVITGLQVIIDALSTPKVSFDPETRIVNIRFSFPQWTHSTYRIIAKGVTVSSQMGVQM